MIKKFVKLFFILIMGIALISGLGAAAGCKTKTTYYTVTFNTDGGSSIASKSVESGSAVAKPDDPIKEDYIFDGWYTEDGEQYDFNSAVTKDITLYAKWTEKSDDSNDGDDGDDKTDPDPDEGDDEDDKTDPDPDEGDDEDDKTDPDPDEGDDEDDKTDPDPDEPTDINYTVTFECFGGTPVVAKVIVADGTPLIVPDEPYKPDGDFAGWYEDEECTKAYDFEKPVTEDITLYAKWVQKSSFTVTFNTDGGSEVYTQIIPNGGSAVLPQQPEKEGFTFGGWYEDEDCTVSYDFDRLLTTDINLYAKWTPDA